MYDYDCNKITVSNNKSTIKLKIDNVTGYWLMFEC